jgi:chromosome partitioning protein
MKKKKQRIITFAARKGGVGKTTLTAALGFVLVRRGHSVALCDLDPQASLQMAVDEIKLDGFSIHTTLAAAQRSEADVVLIDCPPGNRDIDRPAIAAADTVIVVTEPHPFALGRTIALIEEIKPKAGRTRAMLLNRMSDKRRRDMEIVEGLKEMGWPVWTVRTDASLVTAIGEGRVPSSRGKATSDLGTIADQLHL